MCVLFLAARFNQDSLPSNERRFPGEEGGLKGAGVGGFGGAVPAKYPVDTHVISSSTESSSLTFREYMKQECDPL